MCVCGLGLVKVPEQYIRVWSLEAFMLRALYLCTGVVRAIGRTSPDVYTSNYVVMATDLQTCICLQWARVSV